MVENRGPELLGVNIFFITAAIIATALRCYVRAGIVKAFGRDDALMVLALVRSSPWVSGSGYVTNSRPSSSSWRTLHSLRWEFAMAQAAISRTSRRRASGAPWR